MGLPINWFYDPTTSSTDVDYSWLGGMEECDDEGSAKDVAELERIWLLN